MGGRVDRPVAVILTRLTALGATSCNPSETGHSAAAQGHATPKAFRHSCALTSAAAVLFCPFPPSLWLVPAPGSLARPAFFERFGFAVAEAFDAAFQASNAAFCGERRGPHLPARQEAGWGGQTTKYCKQLAQHRGAFSLPRTSASSGSGGGNLPKSLLIRCAVVWPTPLSSAMLGHRGT